MSISRKIISIVWTIALLVSLPGCINFKPDIAPLNIANPNSSTNNAPAPITLTWPNLNQPFCTNDKGYEDTQNCNGDQKNGWKEFFVNGELAGVLFVVGDSKYQIRVVDGKYYMSCALTPSTEVEIDENDIKNIKDRVDELEVAKTDLETAKTDYWAGLANTISSAATLCILGALYGAAGGTIPLPGLGTVVGAVGGCLVGAGAGSIAGIVGSIMENLYKQFVAGQKITKIENILKDIRNALGLMCN